MFAKKNGSSLFQNLNDWSTKYKNGAESGGVLNGVGSVLGGGVGKLLQGGFGKVVGSIWNGVKSIFGGGSPPEKFAEHGKKFATVIAPAIINKHQSNPNAMMTELSKAYNYMVLFYQAHLKGSSSSRSKKGNQQGLDLVLQVGEKISQIEQEIAKSGRISTSTVSYTYPRQYLQSLAPFSGNHNGQYTKYNITLKSGARNIGSNDGSVTATNSGSSNYGLIALIGFGVLYLTGFTKKLKL